MPSSPSAISTQYQRTLCQQPSHPYKRNGRFPLNSKRTTSGQVLVKCSTWAPEERVQGGDWSTATKLRPSGLIPPEDSSSPLPWTGDIVVQNTWSPFHHLVNGRASRSDRNLWRQNQSIPSPLEEEKSSQWQTRNRPCLRMSNSMPPVIGTGHSHHRGSEYSINFYFPKIPLTTLAACLHGLPPIATQRNISLKKVSFWQLCPSSQNSGRCHLSSTAKAPHTKAMPQCCT